jgi:hypothetical protein
VRRLRGRHARAALPWDRAPWALEAPHMVSGRSARPRSPRPSSRCRIHDACRRTHATAERRRVRQNGERKDFSARVHARHPHVAAHVTRSGEFGRGVSGSGRSAGWREFQIDGGSILYRESEHLSVDRDVDHPGVAEPNGQRARRGELTGVASMQRGRVHDGAIRTLGAHPAGSVGHERQAICACRD